MTSEEAQFTSKAEVNEELKALLRSAYNNGIDIKGGFECRNGGGHPDWDVIVTEVEKTESSE